MNFSEVLEMMSGGIPFYVASFIIVLSLLVFVHEWGHYIVAKLCGVRVETFSIGFGKELIGRNDKHGTRWKISMIPLGGYVKLYGDVDPASAGHDDTVQEGEDVRPMTEAEKSEAFFAQPVWKRSLIVFAGPAINYIFAFILMVGLFAINGQPVTPSIASAIVVDSSAFENGFQPHDKILAIDDVAIDGFDDIRLEMVIALNLEKKFTIERNGEVLDIMAAPRKVVIEDRFGFKQSKGLLGLIGPRHAVRVDTITRVGDVVFDEEATLTEKLSVIDEHLGKPFEIEMASAAPERDVLLVNPYEDLNESIADENSEEYGVLMISNSLNETYVKRGVVTAMAESANQLWVVTRGTVEALGQMFTGTRSATELGGVIRIGAIAGDMAKQGLVALVMFTALLSINLGLINLFPIPMLDGGHLVFYFFEAIRGKPVPEQVQEYAFRAGLVFLVGVMAFANLNDLIQLAM